MHTFSDKYISMKGGLKIGIVRKYIIGSRNLDPPDQDSPVG